MTDQEFATYLSAWEVARNARDQDPTSASIARANSAREAYLAALDIQRGDARELTVDWAPGVPQEARDRRPLPDMSAPGAWVHFAMSAPPPEPKPVHVTFTEESNVYRVTIPGTPPPKPFGHFAALVEALGLSDWAQGGPWPATKKVLGYLYDVGFPAPPGTTPTVKDLIERSVAQDQEAREAFRRARQSPDEDTHRHPELVRGEFVDDVDQGEA